jgi:hypothetical protein
MKGNKIAYGMSLVAFMLTLGYNIASSCFAQPHKASKVKKSIA